MKVKSSLHTHAYVFYVTEKSIFFIYAFINVYIQIHICRTDTYIHIRVCVIWPVCFPLVFQSSSLKFQLHNLPSALPDSHHLSDWLHETQKLSFWNTYSGKTTSVSVRSYFEHDTCNISLLSEEVSKPAVLTIAVDNLSNRKTYLEITLSLTSMIAEFPSDSYLSNLFFFFFFPFSLNLFTPCRTPNIHSHFISLESIFCI